MGRRGPAPKPTALRVLEGNPSKRPLPKGEPKPPPGIGPCPEWLNADGRRIWGETVPVLERIPGLLTQVDRHILADFCNVQAMLEQAEAVLNAKGLTFTAPSGYKQQRPEVGIVSRMTALVKALGAELGLSPASRSRISTGEREDDDELERLLS